MFSSHFLQPLNDLPAIREKVAELESPNPEDDRVIKFAIVGYSYFRPTSSWGLDEFNFVTERRREVADLDLGPQWVEFVRLASGYLLGLQQAGQCNDSEFAVFEA